MKKEISQMKLKRLKREIEFLNSKKNKVEKGLIERQTSKIANCKHAFVITGIDNDEVEGRKYYIKYCPKCGLTNKYSIDDMYDNPEADKMNELFREYGERGKCISKRIISEDEAKEYYQTLLDKGLNDDEILCLMEKHF